MPIRRFRQSITSFSEIKIQYGHGRAEWPARFLSGVAKRRLRRMKRRLRGAKRRFRMERKGLCFPRLLRAAAKNEKRGERAASHRDLYAPKRIFFPNTASKCHGRRQPCHGILSCLEKKSLALECFAVLNRRFFFTVDTSDCRNTGCIPKVMGFAVEEKIHSKPYKSLCESA